MPANIPVAYNPRTRLENDIAFSSQNLVLTDYVPKNPTQEDNNIINGDNFTDIVKKFESRVNDLNNNFTSFKENYASKNEIDSVIESKLSGVIDQLNNKIQQITVNGVSNEQLLLLINSVINGDEFKAQIKEIIGEASSVNEGLMSTDDKEKLDNIEQNANNYKLTKEEIVEKLGVDPSTSGGVSSSALNNKLDKNADGSVTVVSVKLGSGVELL